MKLQTNAWRSLFFVGGRAPCDALEVFCHTDHVITKWQVSRASFFLRCINSPAGSLQQLALITLRSLDDRWFRDVVADLRRVMPNLSFTVRNATGGPFLRANGCWSDFGEWLSAQPYAPGLDIIGPGQQRQLVRWHIRRMTGLLKNHLQRDMQYALFKNITEKASLSQASKLTVLSGYFERPAPPLHIALDWVGPLSHRSAVVALFCGDMFLARYAGNYFAKEFIPRTAGQIADASNLGIPPSRVCLHCWHYLRQIVLEGEGHIFFECPLYEKARTDFLLELSSYVRNKVGSLGSGDEKLSCVIGSFCPSDWAALGRFTARVRQTRRSMRRKFDDWSQTLSRRSFANRRVEWRSRGGFVCRHGAFFKAAQGSSCPCMRPIGDNAWQFARYMPSLDTQLRALVTVPFDAEQFMRLGQLQAEMRRRCD